MKQGTEDFMLEFQKYVEDNEIEINDENIQKEMNKFILVYNNQIMQKKNGMLRLNDIEQADQYYEIALESEDEAYSKKMLKKAIKLNPEFIDAYVELASYIENNEKRLREYRKIEKMAIEKLKEQGITKESEKGHFYGIIETRPYIRLKHRIMFYFKHHSCYSLAIKEGEEIIELNETDNMGVRFTLMGMYALLEQKENAEKLFEKYPEESVPMHLYIAVLYYKLQDIKKSIYHLKAIKKLVPKVNMFFGESIEDELTGSMEGYYRPYSIEEILLFMEEQNELFTDNVLTFIEKIWN